MTEPRRSGPGRPAQPEDLTGRNLRRRFVVRHHQPAPSARVFPLLCPTREYDWIDGWSCRMLYSDSGVAEQDCVFDTQLESHTTWVVTRYEPPTRIEFCCFTDVEVVMQLKIDLSDRDDGTCELRWERIFTSVGSSGRDRIGALTVVEVEGRLRDLNERLAHYLECGEMLRPGLPYD